MYASESRCKTIFDLPNEILLTIFSLFPTTSILKFNLVCRTFHSLVSRVLHHRLQVAASLDGYVLYSEVFPPYKQYTNARFFCQSLGTPGLLEIIQDFSTELKYAGHGDKINRLYSHFRPGRREPNFRAALRHPAGDIPGSRTYKTDDMPLFDGMMDEDDRVLETVTIDASDLFCQLMAASHLVKRNRFGRLDSTQSVGEGTIRVWRDWLSRQCETKSWTDGDVVVVHLEANQSSSQATNSDQFDPSKDPSVLWLNTGRSDVGIRFRVKERLNNPNAPVVQENEIDAPVSYQVELTEVLIRTTNLLLKLEEAQRQRSNDEGKSTVLNLY